MKHPGSEGTGPVIGQATPRASVYLSIPWERITHSHYMPPTQMQDWHQAAVDESIVEVLEHYLRPNM